MQQNHAMMQQIQQRNQEPSHHSVREPIPRHGGGNGTNEEHDTRNPEENQRQSPKSGSKGNREKEPKVGSHVDARLTDM